MDICTYNPCKILQPTSTAAHSRGHSNVARRVTSICACVQVHSIIHKDTCHHGAGTFVVSSLSNQVFVLTEHGKVSHLFWVMCLTNYMGPEAYSWCGSEDTCAHTGIPFCYCFSATMKIKKFPVLWFDKWETGHTLCSKWKSGFRVQTFFGEAYRSVCSDEPVHSAVYLPCLPTGIPSVKGQPPTISPKR